GLVQTAGRRAIVRDRDAFPVFVDAIRRVEPQVRRALERVTRQVDEDMTARLSDTIRRVFGRVLKELADLENPMRSLVGDAAGQGAIFEAARAEAVLTVLGDPAATSSATATRSFDDGTAPRLEELASRSPVE